MKRSKNCFDMSISHRYMSWLKARCERNHILFFAEMQRQTLIRFCVAWSIATWSTWISTRCECGAWEYSMRLSKSTQYSNRMHCARSCKPFIKSNNTTAERRERNDCVADRMQSAAWLFLAIFFLSAANCVMWNFLRCEWKNSVASSSKYHKMNNVVLFEIDVNVRTLFCCWAQVNRLDWIEIERRTLKYTNVIKFDNDFQPYKRSIANGHVNNNKHNNIVCAQARASVQVHPHDSRSWMRNHCRFVLIVVRIAVRFCRCTAAATEISLWHRTQTHANDENELRRTEREKKCNFRCESDAICMQRSHLFSGSDAQLCAERVIV